MQLTIDTSSQKVGLALSDSNRIIQEYCWYSQENHTRELIPNIMQLLEKNKIAISSVTSIVIARGPGSFNGLRVGMSVAKGLAFAREVPLVGISTLSAEAYLHAASHLPVCPLHEAGRSEVATALFQMQEGQWQQLQEEHITTAEQLQQETTAETIFCGEITISLAAKLRQIFGAQAQIFPIPDTICRASLVAQLGWQRLVKKDYDNPATLQPLYLRRPPITRPGTDKYFIIHSQIMDE